VSFQAGFKFGRPNRQYLTSNHNYHVTRREPMLVLSKTFPEQALQRVSFYGPGNLFSSDRETETRAATRSGPNQNGHKVVAATNVIFENLLKFDCAGKS